MITKLKTGRCVPVLPLIYDDSLSYYEQLCKISNKLNEVISTINDTLDEKIVEYIDERFNDILLNAVYDEENEALVLYLDKGDSTS